MKTCIACGRDFSPRHGWQKYCTPECRKVVQREQQRQWYSTNQAPAPTPRACLGCGTVFEAQSSTHRYCDRCAHARLKAYKREYTRQYRAAGREDRTRWDSSSKEGRRQSWQRYYQNHKKSILDRIRRTRYEQGLFPGKRSETYWRNRCHLIYEMEMPCAVCGTRDNLQVHHRVPVEEGGSDELDNLVVLCEAHHIGSGTGFHSLGAEEFAARYSLWLGPDEV